MLLTEYSLDENIFIKAYELSDENMKKSFTLFKKITINFTPLSLADKLKYSCITFKSRHLCLFIESDIFIFDLNTSTQVATKSFVDQEIDINYFLSPTNPSASNLISITPIEKNDDLIALNNLNELIYLNLNQNNRLKIKKNYKYKISSFKLSKNLLLGFDSLEKKLICFNLDDLAFTNIFDEPKFTIDLISSDLLYGFSLNLNYFYTIENRLLKLYKTNDHKKIGEMILYTNVINSMCTNDFVCLTMRDNRFVTFLIAESNEYDKIRHLESRSGILTDEENMRCAQVLENVQNALDSSSSDDDDENLNKFLFEKKDIEHKSYEKFKKMSMLPILA